MMWREWLIRVEDSHDTNEEYKTVSLQAFIPPDIEDDARCSGFVSTFYGNSDFTGTCAIPPYGNALFLNSSEDISKDNSQMWKIRQTDGARGQFEIAASNKPDVCLRVLAMEDCQSQPTLIENSTPYFTETRKYRSWKLMRRYDLVANSSPPPPPSPLSPSPPTPVGTAPGPIISAPSSTTSPHVTVLVQSTGGSSDCSVSSIVLTSVGAAVGSLPQTVEVSVSRPGLSSVGVLIPLAQIGYNSIHAVGKCINGGTTEKSNWLSVFYAASSRPDGNAPSIITSSMGSTSADITWAAGSLDGSFQYIVFAVAVGGSCSSTPVATSTVSSSTLTATLTGLDLNKKYEIFVKATSLADAAYFRCSAGESVQTWPYAFLPKYQSTCSGCNPIIRCSFENNLITNCLNISMGGTDMARVASVQPMMVGTAAKILVGAGVGTVPAVFRCDLDSALTTVSNCISTSIPGGSSSTQNRIGGILVYKDDTKVLLTESDGDKVVFACDLNMGSGNVVSACVATGKNGGSLVLSGTKPDGITRKGNTVYVSSRDNSNGGIWTCTLDESAANNADALTSCTQENLATPVFDLYYDSISDVLWGTRNLQTDGAALVSCPQGNTANCKNGVAPGETVSIESKGITSGRGYLFWTSTNVFTGTVDGNNQASSIRNQSVPAISGADEIKWYPPL